MPYISCAVFLFVCLFPGEYKKTAFVLFLAFVVNIALMALFEQLAQQNNSDVVFIYGAIDCIVACFMLKYGGKYKIGQACILVTAVLLNAIILMDYNAATISTEAYYYIIFALNIGQILLISGGIYGSFTILTSHSIDGWRNRSSVNNPVAKKEVQ